MKNFRTLLKICAGIFVFILFSFSAFTNDTIRIMPVGNSITAGEHYKFPALEERTGYRKALYEMLIKDGYLVDFVGSQMHGIRSKADTNWYDWNCEAYPGLAIPDIAVKLQQALVDYKPDILLVHVGTNGKDWEEKPGQVENMLDSINSFSISNNHPITVFLCLIINHFKSEDPLPITRFNSEVEKMVQARKGDKIRIILVDMENGAGLDYSDNLPDPGANPPYEGGDMIGYRWPGVPIDKYHPNDKGNIKMAKKFYQELVKVLEVPKEKRCRPNNSVLNFKPGIDSSFTFNTGMFKGTLRQNGKSNGIVPLIYIADSSDVTYGEGLFNHYRVFTRGKRYGYGARRWPSSAKLCEDGSIEVLWRAEIDRPFELRASYKWVSPNSFDLVTTITARENLEAFEVFLASYFGPTYMDSRVWATKDPKVNQDPEFVRADKELGEWLAFPRDKTALEVINDGRWNLEPHPLNWTIMPNYALPVTIRRDTLSGLTVVMMTKQEDCFGIFTPFSEEKHISNYMSLFGYNVKKAETRSAHSRVVILTNPSEKEILESALVFFTENSVF